MCCCVCDPYIEREQRERRREGGQSGKFCKDPRSIVFANIVHLVLLRMHGFGRVGNNNKMSGIFILSV